MTEDTNTRVRSEPLGISAQGSFSAGGTVVSTPGTFDPTNATRPAGQTLHGDHAHVSYQIPAEPRGVPLVLWHGYGEGGGTWDTTPDGRDGFRTIFLRCGHAVYVLDQPRRGAAAKTTVAAPVTTATLEQMWYAQFRFGVWPGLFPPASSSPTTRPRSSSSSAPWSPIPDPSTPTSSSPASPRRSTGSGRA